MDRINMYTIVYVLIALMTAILTYKVATAGNKNITGWEVGSEYDQLYNPKQRD